jgi:2-polyprenyl-3-methyl-5-hydroxy-6-metoxy-1,4-benzoquinol methylase
MSHKYYDEHAQEFFESTVNADMSVLIEKFTSLLNPGAHILDAGSGVGRDTKTFLDLGFRVSAFDASEEMVKISSNYTGINTRLLKFEEMDYSNQFDGIWACASLLHVDKSNSESVFKKLSDALTQNGILFVSYKNLEVDYEKDGRHFTCFNSETFKCFLNPINLFMIIEEFNTEDVRVNRKEEKWYNCILRKIQ